MRVNHADALSVYDVLKNEIAQKRRFPRSRFAEDIKVMTTIFPPDAKRTFSTPHKGSPNGVDVVCIHAFKTSLYSVRNSVPWSLLSPFPASPCPCSGRFELATCVCFRVAK